jgi:ferredoxin
MTDEIRLTLDDDLLEHLNALTGGAAAICYQCGTCTASCPWGRVREDHLPVRTIIHQAQLGVPGWQDKLWLCTTCGQCEALCPRGVKIIDVFRGLRELAWESNKVEKGLPSLLWSIYWNENPWSQPPSQRAAWAKGLDIPIFDSKQHEILLYIGCTSSYDQRAQKIARALVSVLNAAGVKYGYLGNDEPCCGESALSVGNLEYFNEIAHKTAGIFKEKKVTQLVAISPHCYDVFKNHYPQAADTFKPIPGAVDHGWTFEIPRDTEGEDHLPGSLLLGPAQCRVRESTAGSDRHTGSGNRRNGGQPLGWALLWGRWWTHVAGDCQCRTILQPANQGSREDRRRYPGHGLPVLHRLSGRQRQESGAGHAEGVGYCRDRRADLGKI